jgi:hypothetical protein
VALVLDVLRAGHRPRISLPPGPTRNEAAQIMRTPHTH